MFWTARYAVFNEEDYIISSIKSIYNYVDSIVIVEGILPFIERKYYTEEESSIDNTVQLIKDFQEYEDPDKKITFHQIGVVRCEDSKGELNRIIYNFIDPATDVFISIDGDELLREEEMLRAKKYFEEDSSLLAVRMKDLMFWQDFNHLLVFDGMKAVTRIFRYKKDGTYKGIFFADKNGEVIDHVRDDRVIDLSRFLNKYHFGWVRERSKIIEKRVRTLRNLVDRKNPNLKHLVNVSDRELEREALLQCKLYTEEYDPYVNERVVEYKGEPLPELKGHKFENRQLK